MVPLFQLPPSTNRAEERGYCMHVLTRTEKHAHKEKGRYYCVILVLTGGGGGGGGGGGNLLYSTHIILSRGWCGSLISYNLI